MENKVKNVLSGIGFYGTLAVMRWISGNVNDARRTAALTKIDFAVLPETKSQGLFHQIHKEVTFCGLPHGAYA